MDDTISRAAAIEVMRKAKDKSELHRMLVQLPSATDTNVGGTDTISRAAALSALNGLTKIFLNNLPPTIDRADAVDAIKALPSAQLAQDLPNGCTDTISRQAAIDMLKNRWKKTRNYEGIGDDIAEECELYLKQVPSAQPGQRNARVFQGIIVEYPSISAYPEYDGKPYFSIKYTENGQEFIGYGTYKPEVLSEYLKEYFMPPAQPGWIPVTERLPKPNEYENDVRVYYLVQNEYGDMMVCSWHGSYWTRMYRSTKVKDKVVAWMPLPKPWKGEGHE